MEINPNVKMELNNIEQVQIEYRKIMDISKVNEFNFLNEEVQEFTSRSKQS